MLKIIENLPQASWVTPNKHSSSDSFTEWLDLVDTQGDWDYKLNGFRNWCESQNFSEATSGYVMGINTVLWHSDYRVKYTQYILHSVYSETLEMKDISIPEPYFSPTFLQFTSVQLLSRVWLFATPWTAARQVSLSIGNSWRLLKLKSIESVMPSNQLILCHALLLLLSIFPSIRVFSNESVLCIRWSKIGVSASASVLPVNIQDRFHLGWTGCISLQSKGLSKPHHQHHISITTVQKQQFFCSQSSL